MIRERDLSGEKLCNGAISSTCCRIVARDAGWNILGSSSLVIRRVLEGGEGWESGGIEDRSIDRADWARFAERPDGEEEDDRGGDSVEVECEGGGWDETSAIAGVCLRTSRLRCCWRLDGRMDRS